MKPKIKISKIWLKKFCEKYHIIEMSLFGSAITEHFTATSDINILVKFDPRYIPGLFHFVKMRNLLTEHFERDVDLKTEEDISKLFRNEIIQESYPIYRKEGFKQN